MFKIYVLKLLVMIVKFEMDAKITRTGSNYEFVNENRLIDEINAYTTYQTKKKQ